jgi:hypothetical protein
MDPTETDMGTFINLELDANGNPTLAFYDTSSSQISVYEYLPQPDLAVTNFWVEESGETYLVGTIRNVGEVYITTNLVSSCLSIMCHMAILAGYSMNLIQEIRITLI